MKKLTEEVIRYGAGGMPYKGAQGPQSTVDVPVEEEVETPEEPKVTVEVIEDDTPLTDEQVVEKVSGTSK